MLGRLWWKDARQFWPIGAALVVTAGVIQWLVLRYLKHEPLDVQARVLFLSAATLAAIYAVAVSASAFAGEREHGTLLLLDTMGVDRRLLWGGKFSFALVTTLGLAGILLGMAALGSGQLGGSNADRAEFMAVVAVLLAHALGWGMFWSAKAATSLSAALLTLLTVVLLSPIALAFLFPTARGWSTYGLAWQLFLAAVGLAASELIMTWNPSRRVGRAAAGHALAEDRAERGARIGGEWTPTMGRLAWQAIRQGRWAMLLFVAAGVAFHRFLPLLWVLAAVIPLWIGVNAFGADSRGRTQRFLANHGARPGMVWSVRIGVGLLGLLAAVAPALLLFTLQHVNFRSEDVALLLVFLANGFAMGQLCGMTIRRGITAVVVAMVGLIATFLPQVALYHSNMLPAGGLLILPAALLAITWAWSADWMLDLPGPRRWIKLGLLMASALGVLVGVFAAYRVTSVPLIAGAGPPPAPVVAEDQNAARFYLEAHRRVHPLSAPKDDAFNPSTLIDRVIDRGWSDEAAPLESWLDSNGEVFALLRRASVLPHCQFHRLDGATLFDTPMAPDLQPLANLLAAEARRRQARGDLAGAWGDVAMLFRMARHLAEGAPMRQRIQANAIDVQATRLAIDWANDPAQTPEQLHAAIDAYQALPPMPGLSETIDTEWRLASHTLELDESDLLAGVAPAVFGPSEHSPAKEVVLAFALMPWERARARRVLSLYFMAHRGNAALVPGQRYEAMNSAVRQFGGITGSPPDLIVAPIVWSPLLLNTPLANWLLPSPYHLQYDADREVTAHRALPQVFALRSWQLRHGGRLPKQLSDIVPSELDHLPPDPFSVGSGRPFRYAPSTFGLRYRFGHENDPPRVDANERPQRRMAAPDRWLLFSVGRDGQENSQLGRSDDIYFPLAPESEVR